jgi:hypothetical protein
VGTLPTEMPPPMICRFLVGSGNASMRERFCLCHQVRRQEGSRCRSHMRVRAMLLTPSRFDNGVKPFCWTPVFPRFECANCCNRAGGAKLRPVFKSDLVSRKASPKRSLRRGISVGVDTGENSSGSLRPGSPVPSASEKA